MSLYHCIMSKTILVVEDTADLLIHITEVLQMEGWQVSCASNGEEALTKLVSSNPDLIITDLMMPEINGFDFIKLVRANVRWKEVPILVFSALPVHENEKIVFDLGANSYLKKPCTLDALVELVNQLMVDSLNRQ